MKTKRYITSFASAVVIAGSLLTARAEEPAVDAGKIQDQLARVPRPELAAAAAKLVLTTQDKTREKTTEAVVVAGVELSPDGAPTLVSEISKLSPDMAPVAAATAAAKLPKQTVGIAQAAAKAAPAQALKIVEAMCKKQPKQFADIATAVAAMVPNLDRSILNGVVESVPSLKPFYVRASEMLAKEGDPIVARYVEQMARDIDVSARALKISGDTVVTAGLSAAQQTLLPSPPAPPPPPVVRPSFVPGGGTPGEANRAQTVVVTPGSGRNYSGP